MRRDYEDVMDVKLRATLKELGFERKGAATYVFERPRVTWFFELKRRVGRWVWAGLLRRTWRLRPGSGANIS